MKKFKIQICLLGYQRYLDKIEKLQNYSSKLFEVTNCIVIKQLPPCDLEWGYSDNCINQLLTSSNIDNSNVELCLCFIDNPIEYNYFTRDLSEFDSKTVLCSFYQVETIFDEQNIDIFNYIHGIILNEIVQIATLHKVNEDYFLHDDTRNCLFDMCGLKKDIAIKYGVPSLCPSCIAKIESTAVDKEFVPLLNKEFKSFKKALFYRIIDFVKERPILSIIITFLSTIIINILSSFLYELLNFIL